MDNTGVNKESPFISFLLRIFPIGVGLAVFIILLVRLNCFTRTEMISTVGYSYEKAQVTEIVQDNLDENGARVGCQYLKVQIKTGEYKGQIFDATSSDGNLFGAVCQEGDNVIVNMSISGTNVITAVYSMDRIPQICAFVGIFMLLICFIGGKNGIKSVLGLVFTFLMIMYLYMPLIYRGFSPFLASVAVCVVTTVATMYLIGGMTKKTLCAMVGTVAGVLIAGLSAFLFGAAADIDGYNVSNIETLVYVGQNTQIQIGGLLFSGILISALGAVMDVAMSVASAIAEIKSKNPGLNVKELFKSGMNVGRDMMGTMSNTLILAFVGGSLSTLIVNYAYNLPALQIINSYSIGIEIMQGIAGSIGVVLTVPFVALISAWMMSRKNICSNNDSVVS
ncbi:MAG: YibE/F family protein [Lachnospiraceae bacterium]